MSQGDKKNWNLTTPASVGSAPARPEGWRRQSWGGRVAVPLRSRRVMSDSSVYTLQGYKDWTAQVRKDWEEDS